MNAADEQPPALSIGAVFGDTGWLCEAWKPVIRKIGNAVVDHRAGVTSPLSVNVVYHVNGEHLPPVDFEGVRTGTLSRKRMELMVQAAVPPEPVEDRHGAAMDLLQAAVSEAETLARRRKVCDGLPEIRMVVEAVLRNFENEDESAS